MPKHRLRNVSWNKNVRVRVVLIFAVFVKKPRNKSNLIRVGETQHKYHEKTALKTLKNFLRNVKISTRSCRRVTFCLLYCFRRTTSELRCSRSKTFRTTAPLSAHSTTDDEFCNRISFEPVTKESYHRCVKPNLRTSRASRLWVVGYVEKHTMMTIRPSYRCGSKIRGIMFEHLWTMVLKPNEIYINFFFCNLLQL